MSVAAKKAAFVVWLALATSSLCVSSALAQCGPTNPSGGTSLRETRLEEQGSLGRVGLLSRNLSFSPGWQGWLSAFAASRSAASISSVRAETRTQAAVVRRPSAAR